MQRWTELVAATAALATTAAPALAAEDRIVSHNPERRSAAFAGASFAIPFGGPRSGRADARLQLTMQHRIEDRGSAAPARMLRGDGLALALSGEDGPRLSFAGRSPSEMRQLGFRDSTVPLIVGAVVLVGVGAWLIFHDCDACDAEPLN